MLINPFATPQAKKRFTTSAIEYGMLAVLAAGAMIVGFNLFLGMSG